MKSIENNDSVNELHVIAMPLQMEYEMKKNAKDVNFFPHSKRFDDFFKIKY